MPRRVIGPPLGQAWPQGFHERFQPCGILGAPAPFRPEKEFPADFTASGVLQGIGAELLRYLVFPMLIQKFRKDSIQGTAAFPLIHGLKAV